jgi:hypothetical protein
MNIDAQQPYNMNSSRIQRRNRTMVGGYIDDEEKSEAQDRIYQAVERLNLEQLFELHINTELRHTDVENELVRRYVARNRNKSTEELNDKHEELNDLREDLIDLGNVDSLEWIKESVSTILELRAIDEILRNR